MTVLLDRVCLRVHGRDAGAHLQNMVSNDVEAVVPGSGTYALLLTPKARVIADLEVFRVGDEYVLGCPPGREDAVAQTILAARFRKKAEVEPSPLRVVWGDAGGALAALDTAVGRIVLVPAAPDPGDPYERWEVARIEAGIPRYGADFDGDLMPAEAGLAELAVSYTKGCYPGQEPVARLHYRGHPNRTLRGLVFGADPPPAGSPVTVGDRTVGRSGSAVSSPRLGPIGLAVIRREVEDGDAVLAGGVPATVAALPFA